MSATTIRHLLLGLACLGSLLVPARAQASQVFPGILQEEADMPCVPTCLVCHTTNPGEQGTWGKLLGSAVKTAIVNGAPVLKAQDEESLRLAFRTYAARAATEPAVAAVLATLKKGEDPQNPGTSVCGAIYGCGGSARVAPQQSPIDGSAVGWTLGAIALASLLRRRAS